MALAEVETRYPDELRADFQQTYGLNIDGMGEDYSFAHAAVLMSQLPSDSRLARKLDPDSEWSQDTFFLAAIEYDLRVLAWQNTKDAQKGRGAPKPPKTPAEREAERKRADSFDKSLIDSVLGLNGDAEEEIGEEVD